MKKVLLTSVVLLVASSPLLAQQQGQGSPGKMFLQQLDTDKNGSVSEAEFLKPQQAQFKHMDKDGNGAISEAEFDAFAQEMQQRIQQMRQQQGGK
jgi:Ca2+-binding EF-hand superfamily protein